MVFKRRDRQPLYQRALRALWPKGGWARAARYIKHRIHRLPDPPEKIARGIFAGVMTTFTPFYGFHFFFAWILALAVRGNVVAALLGTFFGNPLTYVPIGVISMKTGYWMLGIERDPEHHSSLGKKFVLAGQDLWDNLMSLFTGATPDWTDLAIFYREVFYPYLVGGIVPGIITGLVAYYLSVPLIRAYQNRRKGALKARLAKLKKRADETLSSD
ncbi:MAG: DUF2062 domain-containing protein [Thalassococcus sp.]|mgnify:CR=1 FL=1|uniref:DUF2062 domain-containing protein n=1 Tax=Thalassococcus sp. TaxID=1928858 RepID=UPI001B25C049|nr:DUF2062 domain-containing protein [Thalassococcus sp.]MBO6866301.1 DUF2062 domain-containing protein [Thalassococcus sp.]